MTIHVEVVELPHPHRTLAGDVCVVIDVIRATTTLVSLFDAGCSRVYLTGERHDAADMRSRLGSDAVLLAEMDNGAAPPGYDLEPAPSLVLKHRLDRRTALLATANGTPAALAVARAGAKLILLGALRNLQATAEFTLREARGRGANITLVCSGQLRNSRPALEDVYCAGLLVGRLKALGNGVVELNDSALMAEFTALALPDAQTALLRSMTGRRFVAAGREEDVRLCAVTDASGGVPAIVNGEGATDWPVELLDA